MAAVPVSTYRLQVTSDFTLSHAAGLVDYVSELGADWIYLSPVLQATRGSQHGYDVVDHSTVDEERGGGSGLDAFAASAHEAGRKVLIDIVPNHMGVAEPAQNAWWWDVLAKGQASRYAEAFDIDWSFGNGKLRIPVLGEDDPELTVVDGELRYFDHRFPLAEGTANDDADAATVHSRQHYELVHWRRADAELNYRRFFAVNSLAAIRVEVPWVFAESHTEIKRWFDEGIADGLRVDHPDGLLDPGAYLDDLARLTNGSFVLVEKILEGEEQLPAWWAAAGTTGYDALADIDRVLIDPSGQDGLETVERELRGSDSSEGWERVIRGTKRAIADGILRSEVLRLERNYFANRERTDAPVADALAELLACFPVYRSYLPAGRDQLDIAAARASENRPDLAETIAEIVPVLADPTEAVAIRFQQTSGMVMAKGVEDTAFYRYSRLASLTEVGADPAEFAIGVDEFHRRQLDRQARFPASMTTLSTHDTKRGEDTRARINVLAELPHRWAEFMSAVRERVSLDDGPLENLLWQSFVGAWPASRERLHEYSIKASREAGTSTTWTEPNEEFESRMAALVDAIFDDERVSTLVNDLVLEIRDYGWGNSLSAKLVQLTAPGVPDVYQGSELWETSLVDPDNRRPVDFDLRRLYLAAVAEGAHPPVDDTGAAKLLVVTKALRARRDRPHLFTRYAPLDAIGDAAEHAIVFDRGGAITVATRLPVSLEKNGGWRDTTIPVPGKPHIDLLTDREYPGGSIALSDLLSKYPVALLVPVEDR